MIVTSRGIGLLLTMVFATGGVAWGVHTFLAAASDTGSDYGLDTNGNGKFEWLVVEANVNFPEAGTWDVSADLSAASPPGSGACGSFGKPPPMPMVRTSASYPIAWLYERYFFPAGAQTVRLAFDGTEIARADVDGPYGIHAVLSLGGFPYPGLERPQPIRQGDVIEWNYMTSAYPATAFEPPHRPAYFSGPHSDRAVDVDSDGLADVLQLTADVHVNDEGNYSLYGTLSEVSGDGVRVVAYAGRMVDLGLGDTKVDLRFRGDQIRTAGLDGPWDFAVTLYRSDYPYMRGATPPSDGVARPGIVPYPEMLCGRTAAYPASDFDDTPELLQYTGHFGETTPDLDGDGLHDALVVRAEVDVLVAAGFDVVGTLRSAGGSTVVARAGGQAWLSDGTQWVEFAFPGPEIRSSAVDGPYVATLSLTPTEGRIDPTTTYTTAAYKASDFDDAVGGTRGYWIGDLTAQAVGGDLAISARVVRAPDMLTVVMQDTLLVNVADAGGAIVGTFKEQVYLPSGGSEQTFSFSLPGLSAGTYTVTAILGPPDQPVDTRTVRVTV